MWPLSENWSQWDKLDNYSVGSWELRQTEEEVECSVIKSGARFWGEPFLTVQTAGNASYFNEVE